MTFGDLFGWFGKPATPAPAASPAPPSAPPPTSAQTPPPAAPPPPGQPRPPAPALFVRLPAAIRAVAPHLTPAEVEAWVAALAAPLRTAGITTPNTLAAFLGQATVESAGFRALSEDMNYSAARLCEVWPGRFTGPRAVPPATYAANPEKLACYVYAGRLGNGTEASGDGWTYRGAGLIQITGRDLHTRFAQTVGLGPDACTAWMLTPAGAAASAGWWWTIRDHPVALNQLAEKWDIEALTRAVNGGLGDYAGRLQASTAARTVLAA